MAQDLSSSEDGASPAQALLGATRQNNLDLLKHLVSTFTPSHPSTKPPTIPSHRTDTTLHTETTRHDSDTAVPASSSFLNSATDALGFTALHYCCKYGSLECLDYILDQDGVDLDVPARMNRDTPLHLAVGYVSQDPDCALEMVEFLVDAGASVRVRNGAGDVPLDVCGSGAEWSGVREALEKADVMEQMGTDVVTIDDVDLASGSDGGESD